MQHSEEIERTRERWERKPLLREVYGDFYRRMAQHLVEGATAEIGSGIGHIKQFLPQCITTDQFPNPGVDRVETVYDLKFEDGELTNVLMLHVFHHLQYPGTALGELCRVLRPGGRLILLEPYISLLGMLVYGALHAEPVAWRRPITWEAADDGPPTAGDFYAAQGNATRVFFRKTEGVSLTRWNVVAKERFSGLSYVLSGGYTRCQFYPTRGLPAVRALGRLLDRAPPLFATCALIVLEKTE